VIKIWYHKGINKGEDMIKEVIDKEIRMKIAKEVLLDLPEWFGIEEYTKEYIENSGNFPFFAAYDKDIIVGFISLKETSEHTIEIYCMGVIKKFHNNGFGKKLFDSAKLYSIEKKYKFMQVKTVKQGTYDIYDKTNAFYKSVGFLEFEVFPKLWDEWNPCQVFVLAI
jgi:GNAT superfamily N-acetyltransferase